MANSHSTHHAIYLLNGQAKAAGLEPCGEVGLQQSLEISPLVEVIAFYLWHILWELTAGHQDGLHGHSRSMGCHLSVKITLGVRVI